MPRSRRFAACRIAADTRCQVRIVGIVVLAAEKDRHRKGEVLLEHLALFRVRAETVEPIGSVFGRATAEPRSRGLRPQCPGDILRAFVGRHTAQILRTRREAEQVDIFITVDLDCAPRSTIGSSSRVVHWSSGSTLPLLVHDAAALIIVRVVAELRKYRREDSKTFLLGEPSLPEL